MRKTIEIIAFREQKSAEEITFKVPNPKLPKMKITR